MSTHISHKEAGQIAATGLFLGRTQPCAETKQMWWQVYLINDRIVACVCSAGGVLCGTEITAEALTLYVDDEHEARRVLHSSVPKSDVQPKT